MQCESRPTASLVASQIRELRNQEMRNVRSFLSCPQLHDLLCIWMPLHMQMCVLPVPLFCKDFTPLLRAVK